MQLAQIFLKNYRNYAERNFSFTPRGAILRGDNGTGKTNLLEAIAYFAFGRSFRLQSDAQLISFEQPYFSLHADFFSGAEKQSFYAAADRKGKKIIRHNGASLPKTSELFNLVKVVYFSPDDVDLAAGPPVLRRRFLDQALCQSSPLYVYTLKNFQHILKQRNALLKLKQASVEKKVWDEQFAKAAAEVTSFRLKWLDFFCPLLKEKYEQIRENEDIDAYFCFSFKNYNTYENSLRESMAKNEAKELTYGRSLFGPHLDYLNFTLKNTEARYFASQGQKRSLAIAARLAQAEMLNEKDNQPILMFDDILSELDAARSFNILEHLGTGHQVFIATPNILLYRELGLPVLEMEEKQ